MLLFDFVCFRITLATDSLVKLHRQLHFFLQKTPYMVESIQMVVNAYQIWVNGWF